MLANNIDDDDASITAKQCCLHRRHRAPLHRPVTRVTTVPYNCPHVLAFVNTVPMFLHFFIRKNSPHVLAYVRSTSSQLRQSHCRLSVAVASVAGCVQPACDLWCAGIDGADDQVQWLDRHDRWSDQEGLPWRTGP